MLLAISGFLKEILYKSSIGQQATTTSFALCVSPILSLEVHILGICSPNEHSFSKERIFLQTPKFNLLSGTLEEFVTPAHAFKLW